MKQIPVSNTQLLKEIAELLNEETELKSMLSGALRKFINGSDFTTGWMFFITEEGHHQLVAAENLPPSLEDNHCQLMTKGGCWCVNKFLKGSLTKASNIIECQRIEKAILENRGDTADITYHATVPLQSGSESFGLMNIAAPNKTHFSKDELALIESVAFQIGSAIKRIMLTKKEQDLALIAERNRLARDLHDSVNQLLFSLTLTARGGAVLSDKPDIKETFQTIQGMAQEALSEMRALIWQLRPQGLEKGFIQAVKGYADMLGIEVIVKVDGVTCLSSKIEEVIWRVSQEALNNCKKHSGVNQVHYSIQNNKESIELQIKDHGCGFHFQGAKVIPSVGIQSMKERVEALGGKFTLISQLGKGTEISICIPL